MPVRKNKSKRRIQTRRGFNRLAAVWLAGVTVAVGLFVVLFSRAAGPGRMYIDPSAGQVAAGSTVQVTVREDSGTTPVNAVQADVTYSAATLDYLGADGTGSAFGIEAPSNNTSGLISVTRGTITPVTGDQPVVKLSFRVKSGTSALAIKSTSVLASASTNTNILGNYGNATLGVLAVNQTPAPTASPTPRPVSTPTPVVTLSQTKPTATPDPQFSPTPVVSPEPSVAASVSPAPSTAVTPAAGTPAVTASPAPAVANAVKLPVPIGVPSNSTTTYEIDGKAVLGNAIDGTKVSDGSHTVTATTVDENGKVVKTTKSTVNVNTKKTFWQNAALVAQENAPAIILVTLMVLVAIGGFIFYRRNLSGNNSLAWPS